MRKALEVKALYYINAVIDANGGGARHQHVIYMDSEHNYLALMTFVEKAFASCLFMVKPSVMSTPKSSEYHIKVARHANCAASHHCFERF
jgi:hypothetical protein